MSKRLKILFLINPKSGVQRKSSVPALIDNYIDKSKFEYRIEETQYKAHACVLAKEAVEQNYDVVVAIGGDGTVNEVARSIVHTNTALGIIPCGSGNGFARHIGIPINVKKSILFLNNAVVKDIDYGKINGHPFFCTCGVGFDAMVSYHFANMSMRGFAGYVHRTVVDWVKYKSEVYEIECEDREVSERALVVACGNASQYGNNFYIAPGASMCDGKLSVAMLTPFTAFAAPKVVTQIFNYSIEKNSHFRSLEASWVRIRRKSAGPVHFDGEPLMMDAELMIEIVPLGLKVMAEPGWNGEAHFMPMHKQILDMVGIN